ncbi:hypothetical protein ASG11_17765 [Sphingomonas sp. Leaf357]|uniref:hypothetical protein n=1 Tax=Sphingomonas sp. Leaf357 TaxID=1736350 RepID=UPI0006F531C0|nr:hypothetical protein [Sphingomonas sp. Leaf357]KQS01501.1 hypothetical protein ASG11_17765 [Sphingomonas sp. Leaf357]
MAGKAVCKQKPRWSLRSDSHPQAKYLMNCLDLISRALRRIGVLAAGTAPSDIEANDALDVLSAIYLRLITEGVFGTLRDVVPTGDYTAGENERVIRSNGMVGVISLPDTINDCGRDRAPLDGSLVIISDSYTDETEAWLYDGAVKSWVLLTELTLTDTAPMSNRDPLGLVCTLATELADEYGQQASDIIRMNAARFHMGIAHNWSNPSTVVRGDYF